METWQAKADIVTDCLLLPRVIDKYYLFIEDCLQLTLLTRFDYYD